MSNSWVICVIGGPANGRKQLLVPDTSTSIGRAPSCALSLEDAAMAGEHCMLHNRDGQLLLRAHDSEHGTLLQGAAVSGEAELQHGDWLRLGRSELTVYRRGRSAQLLRKGQSPHPLSAAALTSLRQHQPLYALLNPALDMTALQLMRETPAQVSCLLDEPEASAKAYQAPYLVSLSAPPAASPQAASPNHDALDDLVELGWGQHWAVYLSYARPPARLRAHLQAALATKALAADHADEDGALRFYDPRALRDYLSHCNARQRALLFGDIQAFLVEDEQGELVKITTE